MSEPPVSDPIRVLVVDDHPLLREGVIHTLEAEDDFTVVGEAGTGEEALRLVKILDPDVILLDIKMPGQGGIATAAKICAANPSVRVLMLTVSENPDDLIQALKAGARGYVLKGVPGHKLVYAVRAVIDGEVFVSASLANTILHELTRDSSADPLEELIERERQVLKLVGRGLTNREIGERLYLAEKTIKHYMASVLQKLHVRSRVEAALVAQRHQLDED
jgi:DNA-binding NarL/FixJ family response regulator